MKRNQHWDVFCRVVDNYGDAGVAWRLARQLVAEHALCVRLFVDAVATLARMVPGLDAARAEQTVDGVTILHWPGTPGSPVAAPTWKVDADVVVEAFGCGLPDAYVLAMTHSARAPLWINLEYLSAEGWIDGCHGLESKHPRLPLRRYFFFPGFSAGSGGLLRERELFARRDAFRSDPASIEHLWRSLHVAIPGPDTVAVSLFCYAHRALPALFAAWADGRRPIACLVPAGVADAALAAWSGVESLHPGQSFVRGSLTVSRIPFVAQDDYDRLLWACHLNFVRGEDSFVRAQWAARPLVWQAYPQAEGAHATKVAAFLERYRQGLPCDAATCLDAFTFAWNAEAGDVECVARAWPGLARTIPVLAAHSATWANRMQSAPDMTSALVKFAANRV